MPGGRGVFACRPIAAGTRLFGEDDWADEAERRNFSTLSPQQLSELKPPLRAIFLRYAYNTAPDQITGTFRPEGVRHPVNFINHGCDPNAGYDGMDDIVALRSIARGRRDPDGLRHLQLLVRPRIHCRCGAPWCRRRVTGNDWRDLLRTGLRLPGFMRTLADRALWG